MNNVYPSPTIQEVEQQLEQLYLRRVAVDSLIRILEDYHQAFEQPQNVALKGALAVGVLRRTQGVLAVA